MPLTVVIGKNGIKGRGSAENKESERIGKGSSGK